MANQKIHHRRTLPSWVLRCPACGYDLRGSVANDEARCPECGRAFTIDDLWQMNSAGYSPGAPKSLSPHEWRIHGWLLIGALVLLSVMTVAALNWMLGP